MKYLIIFFGFFVFLECAFPCLDDIEILENDRELAKINEYKYFTIINHTDKTYIKNGLYVCSPFVKKENNAWKLQYCPGTNNAIQKINRIEPNKTFNKNEKGNLLKLQGWCESDCGYKYTTSEEVVFLLSLDKGTKNIFFGAYGGAYGEYVERHYGEVTSDCKQHVIKYDVHPVWQDKELKITIKKDAKITFDDPKIKEVKKLKLSIYGSTKTQEVDPHTLELVDCSKE